MGISQWIFNETERFTILIVAHGKLVCCNRRQHRIMAISFDSLYPQNKFANHNHSQLLVAMQMAILQQKHMDYMKRTVGFFLYVESL